MNTTYCSRCHGIGQLPTGGQTMTSAVNMSWGTCPACDGTGTHVDCSECVDTGVNVYDADFDPAHPQPCQHCQPVTDADVIYAGIRRYCTDSPHYTGELA